MRAMTGAGTPRNHFDLIRAGARWGNITVLAFVAACGEHDFEPPDPQLRVDAAHVRYTPALFDTIGWPDDDIRAHSGNEVYATRCRVCHGPLGEGGTQYARVQNLEVPSLVDEGWPLATNIDSVRHRVYVGHAGGMPTWGVAGITPREVDAAAFYVLELLRPEVLGR